MSVSKLTDCDIVNATVELSPLKLSFTVSDNTESLISLSGDLTFLTSPTNLDAPSFVSPTL